MRSSLTWKTLQKFYSRRGVLDVPPGWRQQAAVRCDLGNASDPAIRLHKGIYLFDLARDPCELNNLAVELPSVVASLSEKIQSHAAAGQPPKDHESNLRGLAGVNGCAWAHWQDEEQTAYRDCPCFVN
ncbi:arylsulfatase I [Dermacentor silvarum]|uniref:arylsulfatase I n=1 Tax=Dermacentor silvarum TaxID=543639 RepID=UPI00189B93F5|nr:arylsulfatase I [Dermacentor silvarum]